MTNRIITDQQIQQMIATIEKYANFSLADANTAIYNLKNLPEIPKVESEEMPQQISNSVKFDRRIEKVKVSNSTGFVEEV